MTGRSRSLSARQRIQVLFPGDASSSPETKVVVVVVIEDGTLLEAKVDKAKANEVLLVNVVA